MVQRLRARSAGLLTTLCCAWLTQASNHTCANAPLSSCAEMRRATASLVGKVALNRSRNEIADASARVKRATKMLCGSLRGDAPTPARRRAERAEGLPPYPLGGFADLEQLDEGRPFEAVALRRALTSERT